MSIARAIQRAGQKVLKAVIVDGVGFDSIANAVRAHRSCGLSQQALRKRLQTRPQCVSAWLTRARREGQGKGGGQKCAAKLQAPSAAARIKPTVRVNDSDLTFAQAAYYIARMSQRTPVTVAKCGRTVSVEPQARHAPTDHDIGTYFRASACDVLRELEA